MRLGGDTDDGNVDAPGVEGAALVAAARGEDVVADGLEQVGFEAEFLLDLAVDCGGRVFVFVAEAGGDFDHDRVDAGS